MVPGLQTNACAPCGPDELESDAVTERMMGMIMEQTLRTVSSFRTIYVL